MTDTTTQSKRDAKRAEIEQELVTLREELDEAKTLREQRQAELDKINAAIARTETQIVYRTTPGRAALDAKAAALAQVALGTIDLDEARNFEGGGQSEMSLSELNTSLTGLRIAKRDAETELRHAMSRVRAAGTSVVQLQAGLHALAYEEACDELLKAWADLRVVTTQLQVRNSTALPTWDQTWALLRLPRHTCRNVSRIDPIGSNFIDGTTEIMGAHTSAAERRVRAELEDLGVDV